jgi:NADP-reducing hydrogenase subunit HndD
MKKIYADFLGEPGGHKAHELLHTSYRASNLSK